MTSKVNLATPAYNSPNWNTPLNTNFDSLNTALGSAYSAAITSADVTLNTTQAQNSFIILSGTLTGNRVLYLPNAVTGSWIIYNGTSGAFSVTVKSDGGGATGFVITQGYANTVYATVSGASVEVFGAVTDVVKKTGDTMVGNLALPSNGLTVGTTQLYVSSGNVYTSGNFFATSNVTAYNTSDERLKDDVQTLTGALSKINEMRGVSFTSKKDGQRYIGLIAQELQQVYPELVTEGEDGYLYVAYANLVGALIEAINELTVRIEKLESK